jgi:hypothetical protein
LPTLEKLQKDKDNFLHKSAISLASAHGCPGVTLLARSIASVAISVASNLGCSLFPHRLRYSSDLDKLASKKPDSSRGRNGPHPLATLLAHAVRAHPIVLILKVTSALVRPLVVNDAFVVGVATALSKVDGSGGGVETRQVLMLVLEALSQHPTLLAASLKGVLDNLLPTLVGIVRSFGICCPF